ncbi:MAG TPA: thioredoxin domain-containing protein [Candidatus Limnocylindrales bacterium]|jgi:protein-disulfide isomerase|nr:thioredoxin domain-containing protein [Candidatus Limnocylindrales bacterium]
MKLLTAFLLLCCASLVFAQTKPLPGDVQRKIERQVRASTEAPPDAQVTIGQRTTSKFTGYDNLPVTIEAQGQKRTLNFLIDQNATKLIYMTEFDLSEDLYAKNMRSIDLSGRPFRGAENAPVTIAVYDDFQCPFCAKMYVTMVNEVMLRYHDRVKLVMKDYPILDAHPWAMRAAVDALCLAQQASEAYWQFSDYVHTHQQDVTNKVKAGGGTDLRAVDAIASDIGQKRNLPAEPLQACLAKQDEGKVRASMQEGKTLGVDATPTLFVNGQEFAGIMTPESFREMVDRALQESAAAKK